MDNQSEETTASSSSDPLIGQTVGTYLVIDVLGRGGFATVYRAWDKELERDVALKFLSNSGEPLHDKLFRREAKAIAQLNKHPCVVQIYTHGEHAGRHYLALEYVQSSAAALLREVPDGLPVLQALQIVASVTDAVAFAHAHGILHRDIKPANLLIDPDTEHVKLADFGIARLRMSRGTSSTFGVILGSLPYMPPEVIDGRAADARCDIFSIGVTLYELLSNAYPFCERSQIGNTSYVLDNIRKNARVLLRNRRSDIPEFVATIVEKACAHDAEERYQSAELLLGDLRKAIEMVRYPPDLPTVPCAPGRGRLTSRRRLMIPAWIVFLAAVTALLGLYVAFLRDGPELKASSEAAGTTQDTSGLTPKSAAIPGGQEYILAEYLEYVPLSLHNTIKAYDRPPWFRIRGLYQKRTTIRVRFGVVNPISPMVKNIEDGLTYTIEAGKPFDKRVYPSIEILNFEIREETPVHIQWSIVDENEAVLASDKAMSRLLPKQVVKWDLQEPGGKAVDKRFILASLTAWTLTPDPSLRTLGSEMLAQMHEAQLPSTSPENWLALCVTRLFQGDSPLVVVEPACRLPQEPQQTVRTMREVVEQKRATVIEAALLIRTLCALDDVSKKLDSPRMALIAYPDTGAGSPGQCFLLAWSTSSGAWRALDMARLGDVPFEQNTASASMRLVQLFDVRKEVLEAMNKDGLYIRDGESTLALDFAKARQVYEIWGLP
ncbi:MAG: serine/threonine-protein kinase [Candidatus Hydrogenedentes bacterium]|nr:serine/threonine-protein kinase [Candidatus Hydrogenedentota bacterium]